MTKQSGIGRRGFLVAGGLGAAAAGYGAYRWNANDVPSSEAKGHVVIVGGGTAGLAVASRLRRALKNAQITLIEPERTHYYQPGFTLVAAGVFAAGDVVRPEAEFVPAGVRWLEDMVVGAEPERKRVVTAKSGAVSYDFLVLCPGLEMDFGAIEGVERARLGEGNVHCIYDYAGSQRCWTAIQKLSETGGRAIFTDTWTKLKCGGAPKKINLIAEDYCRRQGSRQKVDFRYYSALDHLFDVPVFNQRMIAIYAQRGIPVEWNHRLMRVDAGARKAVFRPNGSEAEVTVEYDFLHFVPPMRAPEFVRQSGLSAGADWVPTDKETLLHKSFREVVVLGDVAALPTSKTGAAVRMQAPVAAANLVALMEGKEPQRRYDGYTACPVVTEYGKVLLAEFGYDKKPTPTIPFLDPGVEHAVGWELKVHVLKPMYFEGVLRGKA